MISFVRARQFGILPAVLILGFLTACSTLTIEQCQEGNWQQIGYDDGANGQPASRFSEHVKACSRGDIQPDQTLWNAGYADGLRRFCTAGNFYSVGRAGRKIEANCPQAGAKERSAAYEKGRRYHELSREISHLKFQRSDLRNEYLSDRRSDPRMAAALYGRYLARVRHVDRQINRLVRERSAYASYP